MNSWIKLIRSNRNFRTVAAANFINRLGDNAETIAYTYLLYKFTGSSAISALGLCVNFLPTVFFQPVAGGILEGRNPKRVMIVADILRGIAVMMLIVQYLSGFLKYYNFMFTMFIISVVECFRVPAGMSIIPYVCDKEEYEVQASLNSAINTIASVLGVMIGGIILEKLSFSMIFGLDAITYIISAIILGFIKIEKKKENSNSKDSFTHFLLDGIAILWKDKKLKTIVIIAIVNNVFATPYMAMEAPIVNGLLGDDSMMLSYMSIAATLGMLLASVGYDSIGKIIRQRRIIFIGIASYALEYLGFIAVSNINSIIVSRTLVLSGMVLCTMFQTLLSINVSAGIISMMPREKISRGGAMMNSLISLTVPAVSGVISIALRMITINNVLYFVSIIVAVTLLFIYKYNKCSQICPDK